MEINLHGKLQKIDFLKLEFIPSTGMDSVVEKRQTSTLMKAGR
jgi:hypothetical protein